MQVTEGNFELFTLKSWDFVTVKILLDFFFYFEELQRRLFVNSCLEKDILILYIDYHCTVLSVLDTLVICSL